MANIFDLLLESDEKRKKRNNRPKRGRRGWFLKKRGIRGKRGSFTTQCLYVLLLDHELYCERG
jgi:hypothetical protein